MSSSNLFLTVLFLHICVYLCMENTGLSQDQNVVNSLWFCLCLCLKQSKVIIWGNMNFPLLKWNRIYLPQKHLMWACLCYDTYVTSVSSLLVFHKQIQIQTANFNNLREVQNTYSCKFHENQYMHKNRATNKCVIVNYLQQLFSAVQPTH